MADLSDEVLQAWADNPNQWDAIRELASECLLYRKAKRADAERVKAVVREAAIIEIRAEPLAGLPFPVADAIATRVAEQLASAAPVLSAEDHSDLAYLIGWCNASIPDVRIEVDRFKRSVAALERLLGAAK